jgi:hypothetical protein
MAIAGITMNLYASPDEPASGLLGSCSLAQMVRSGSVDANHGRMTDRHARRAESERNGFELDSML